MLQDNLVQRTRHMASGMHLCSESAEVYLPSREESLGPNYHFPRQNASAMASSETLENAHGVGRVQQPAQASAQTTHACCSAVGFGSNIRERRRCMRLTLESEPRELPASVGRIFLVQGSGGLPRLETCLGHALRPATVTRVGVSLLAQRGKAGSRSEQSWQMRGPGACCTHSQDASTLVWDELQSGDFRS